MGCTNSEFCSEEKKEKHALTNTLHLQGAFAYMECHSNLAVTGSEIQCAFLGEMEGWAGHFPENCGRFHDHEED